MISSNHRRFCTEVNASPPSPKRVPFESRWQPPASITIPILVGNFDESVAKATPPPPKTNGMDIHKNISLIDEDIFHHDEFNNAIIIGASTTDDSSIYTTNLTEILNKADKITNAENILKLLEDDMDSSLTSFLDSYHQEIPSWRQGSLDYELEHLAYFSSDDPSMSSDDIQSQAFELLDMLYGQDSFRLTQNHAARQRNTSSCDEPVEGNEGDQLVSTRQLTALFATESSFVEEIDPSRPQNSPQRKNTSSSPRDLVLSRQEHVRNESRNVFGSRGNGHDSPLRRRQANTSSRTVSTCSANNLCRQAVPNKPPRFRDLAIRSRSCEIEVDFSDILDISVLTQHPGRFESAKAGSSPFRLTHSEGTGDKLKKVPPPPPHPKRNATPLPLINNHAKNNWSKTDKNSDMGVHCFAISYDDMMSLAQRMSSNRSLGEPSILESLAEKQPQKNHRGRPKSTKQMRGRGRSAQRNKNIRDAYESSGELSGAETSQNSRKSKNSRLVVNRLRKMEHEKTKKERMNERSNTPQGWSRSLDRVYSRGDHKQCQGKVIVTNKKSGIARLLQSKMDRFANCPGRSASGSTHIISGSLSTLDSRSTRRSCQSWDCRKSLESGPTKKSNKSSPKTRIMRSGSTLSAAADIFQHQCIQVSVDYAVMLDDKASCNSSLSCYSENTSD